MIVILIILGVIVSLNIIGFAINKIFFSRELEAIRPYGRLVEVNGHKMHVYSMGDSGKTIVLLPGSGVALPSADFGPLMRELSKEYKVVCVEYFGIGFSDKTDMPRTNENYMQEIRTALSSAGFKPPYILMPHSASGVYSEYYAAKYPDEISAVIMLDTTSTSKPETGNPPRFVYAIGKLQQVCGMTRLNMALIPPAQKIKNVYTEKEIKDCKLFACHVINDTFIDQSLRLLDNIKEVNMMPLPQDIPVLKLISSQSEKRVGAEYQRKHLERLGPNVESKVLDGSHFIYQTRAAEIREATDAFLDAVSAARTTINKKEI